MRPKKKTPYIHEGSLNTVNSQGPAREGEQKGNGTTGSGHSGKLDKDAGSKGAEADSQPAPSLGTKRARAEQPYDERKEATGGNEKKQKRTSTEEALRGNVGRTEHLLPAT
jgi:hypothetical protein